MKKKLMAGLFLLSAWAVFSQRLSTVAVLPFEAGQGGSGSDDAVRITEQIISELISWGSLALVGADQAETAEYLIRGQLSKTNRVLVLTASAYDAKTGKALNSATEQGADLKELLGKIFSFCVQVVENIPFPNYMIGKWRSSISLGDASLICILEFRSDRTVLVERYDTYEHRNDSSLQYHAYGRGTYSYSGYVRRVLSFRDAKGVVYREAPVDGSLSIALSLEDALPKYSSVGQNRISVAFDDAKSSFELINSGFLCGDNMSGPAVYPQAAIAYTHFIKIQ
jgi:TolB-like protein